MEETIIRPYEIKDRSFIRDIAWETAFFGAPASAFFDGKEILADFLTKYFTDYEPQSCFVAEKENKVIGYIIGAKNNKRFENIFLFRIFPLLLFKFIFSGSVFRKKNAVFICNIIPGFFKGEFARPETSKDYPAVLHIDIKENFRDSGTGSKLVSVYLDYLAKNKIKGVWLSTSSEKASRFFNKEGFKLLYQGKRSYFMNILHKDIPLYTFAKEIGK